VRGYTALARTQRAKGEVERALLTLQQGDERLNQIQSSAIAYRAILAAQRARLLILQGNLPTVLHSYQPLPAAAGTSLEYIQQLTWVRLRLAQYQHSPEPRFLTEAAQILAALLAKAEAAGWMSHKIEALLLQALVSQTQGERDSAQQSLINALVLAEPEGYLRIFLEEGAAMHKLLIECRREMARKFLAEEGMRLQDRLNRILAAFPAVGELPATLASKQPAGGTLVEPLTERELEILRMVHDGLSNGEIAEKLIVTVGTVKKHLNNIFGKLAVSSRTQALVSARAHNLL
jgi:LuxR family maltose regulon positive regulatory protein